MTQSTLKAAGFSLLLLAFISQGLQDVPVFHYKTKEALVGQNISLPCYIKNIGSEAFISTQWSKKDTEPRKLVLFMPMHGDNYFVSNVTLKTVKDDNGTLCGTHLELPNITEKAAGTYICDLSLFPSGSFPIETELRVKDKIECDMNSTIEVHTGENLTIRCDEVSDVAYTWSKDEVVVSDSASLHLLSLSEVSAGLYTLTANTGNSRLHQTFTITVLTQTTGYLADGTSQSPPYNFSSSSSSSVSEVTNHSLINAFTTEPTPEPTPTNPTPNSQSVEAQSTSTSTENTTRLSYTQSEANYSETIQTTRNYNQSEGFDISSTASQPFNQSEAVNNDKSYNHSGATTSPVHETSTGNSVIFHNGSDLNMIPIDSFSEALTSTTPTPNTSLGMTSANIGASLTQATMKTTDVTVQQDPPDSEGQKHLVWTLSITGALIIIVVLLLYRRRVIKKRMDLPPAFKPPPPPVKYAAVRNPRRPFPTDRCNSVSIGDDVEMRHTFI